LEIHRWVYKRIFVADGNFKADHVRQKNNVDDVWLSEGSGMIPKREEYFTFLATAIEKLTVSESYTYYICAGQHNVDAGHDFWAHIVVLFYFSIDCI